MRDRTTAADARTAAALSATRGCAGFYLRSDKPPRPAFLCGLLTLPRKNGKFYAGLREYSSQEMSPRVGNFGWEGRILNPLTITLYEWSPLMKILLRITSFRDRETVTVTMVCQHVFVLLLI